MRTLTAILCWAAWLCAMTGIVAGTVSDWRYVSLDLKMASLMVLMLYLASAPMGMRAFQMLWPRDNDRRAKR